LLTVNNIDTYYGAVPALKGLSVRVEANSIVTIIGANGAGKSTLLHTISGIIAPNAGSIEFLDQNITGANPAKIVKLGISLVPEGRRLFGNLPVKDNLTLGAYSRYKKKNGRKERESIKQDFDFVYNIFPVLRARENQLAETLSGGEQQMLAIGRGLMSRPQILLLDEPSIGLAPMLIQEIFKVIKVLKEEKITIMVVEQNARMALDTADRGYVLELGKITLEGNAKDLIENEDVKRAYLGI
jgi:branched-chain amino acid transport system ATP-binding protein